MELSAFAAARARERTGCEVFCGRLGDAPFGTGAFDVITMWDLLEHLPEPLQGLETARRLLKPSGLLLVNTPNENSLLRQVARLLYRGSRGFITTPFNLLDARGAISVTERAAYIGRICNLARSVARSYLDSRARLGFPMAPKPWAEQVLAKLQEKAVQA